MFQKRFYFFFAISLMIISYLLFSTCRKDKGLQANGFPPAISNIMTTKCAIAGCHTRASKDATSGLSLETWDDLFQGDRLGADCIPYSPEYSSIILFTNTYSDLGSVNGPSMPLNQTPLSRDEMNTLINWVKAGAPNANGKIMWTDNPNRKKFYVTNQGCDVVTVFDAATILQMRYISVGNAANKVNQSPHMVQVSPDGKYWYVCFSVAGTMLQKFSTSDDSYIGAITLGSGSWNTFAITNDSKKAFTVDWEANGIVDYVDLENIQLLQPYQGNNLFVWPHGSALNSDNTILYITAQYGNTIYKIDVSKPLNPNLLPDVSLDGQVPNTNIFGPDPHFIAFSPDSLYYYVTCQYSNEVRIMKASNDSLIATIKTGDTPQEISVSKTTPYMFVSCMNDSSASGPYGSVTIINYQTKQWVKNIKTNMSEPHGIAVDDAQGLVYVANRNATTNSPPPHHTTTCGNRIGFMSFIDLKTLNVLPKEIEVAVDPYSVAIRK